MKQKEELTKRERFVEWLTAFMSRHRRWIALGATVAAVAIVAVVVIVEVRERRLDESLRLVERAQDRYDEWLAAEGDDRESIEAEIMSTLDEVISDYSRLYSAQRALFVRGRMHLEEERWEEAAGDFRAVAERFSDSHLALIALSNEAVAWEQSGNLDRAFEVYLELSEERDARNPLRARALFSAGRLQEHLGDEEAAREYYNALVSEYSDSEWTNLARNRILVLETGTGRN